MRVCLYNVGMKTGADKMNQLHSIMNEIDHILAMISESTLPDNISTDRCNGLHALFQEKVKTAVALRFSLNLQSVQPVQHKHNNC